MIVSRQFIERLILLLVSSLIMYYISVKIIEETNGLETSTKDLKKLQSKLDIQNMDLNMHEKSLLGNIVYPEDINVSFDNIGGLENIKNRLDKVLFKPLKLTDSGLGPLFSPPNGIILHGSPGTGKTMIAKAIAKKLDGIFITCNPSLFENKYYGESAKLIKALFTFANKVKPCVIFIDEIDGILGNRNDFDQSLVNEVKTIFLAEMDGIISRNPHVIFIGATNKLYAIDKAVKRRMRLHIEVPLPNEESRRKILELHLKDYNLELDSVLKETDTFSGSDLFELCKLAGLEAISHDRKNITEDDLSVALELLSC